MKAGWRGCEKAVTGLCEVVMRLFVRACNGSICMRVSDRAMRCFGCGGLIELIFGSACYARV